MRAAVDTAHFRQLLGRFATGITIVTTRDAEGRPLGMTASSLASVSLEPPLVLVCIARDADMHDPILQAPTFAINILASDQEALARRFADEHEDRFEGIGYDESVAGDVLLHGALAHIECERHAVYEAGDHTIVVGQVIGGAAGERRPLLYFRGGYGTLG